MSLSRASVSRPVFTLMVTMVVVVLGASALGRLRIDLLPSIELPTITVRTSYDGADPLAMELEVNQWPGVVTVGIFARHRAHLCLLGTPQGVLTLNF